MMRTTVKDVMTTRVASVEAGTPFKDVAETLVEHGISAVPVVDGEQRVLGVVSEGDLMCKEEFRELYCGESYRPPLRARLRRRMAGQAGNGEEKAGGHTAADLMTAPAVTVPASASISRAARIMDECGVKRLVVVDAEGRLRGIVSRRDLLRMYLRDDDETRRRVVEGISPEARWNDRDGILVEVRNGIVTLSGHTRKRSDADAALRSALRMEGVVDVQQTFTWRENDLLEVPVAWDRP
ncbi:CBS domain-containing protein [Nonomuraea gerenzanensis]|uniref:Inosine-5'-monophosphate dehydrogenase n=1 Tax=Nonomuraea gerenzanensis TaxID=93944 RepID=A0A1M4EEZ3_9ACTN|nr:CBS domain-containing protein [Nonomuraea gerenzanensis]UBU08981.1 CBS domain-containing protein [Nonomuraea gerenzanensis]SBO97362.1 Inosine-5'-monophosphate dehydrogenase [Nonomuraea gerenzanensis]